jgi:hypothetical protein
MTRTTVAKRNYQAEYQRRKQLGLAAGRSVTEARGHAAALPSYHPRLEEGLKQIRQGATLEGAASSIRVAPERLRRYLAGTGVVERQRRRLVVVEDLRPRAVVIYSRGAEHTIEVAGFENASLVGRYMAGVRRLLDTNDPRPLDPFRGVSVSDRRGRRYPLETNPRTLYRIAASVSTPFDEIYRIVV